MQSHNIRLPARSELRPANPVFEPFSAKFIEQTLNRSGSVERMRTAHTPPQGFYRFHPADSNQLLFVKIIPASFAPALKKVETLVRAMAQEDLPVIRCMGESALTESHEFHIFYYPYLDSRYARCHEEDIILLGKELGNLHKILRQPFSCRKAESLRQSAHSHGNDSLKDLHASIVDISNAKAAALPNYSSAKRIISYARRFLNNFEHLLLDNCPDQKQMIHADLNYANTLFTMNKVELRFVDFENSLYSWLPSAVDVTMAIQRYVMCAAVSDEIKIALGKKMMQAYRKAARIEPFKSQYL